MLRSGSAPLEMSRKWGIYNIINLLFKTYFKLNSVSLSKNILKALTASRGDMPDLEAFPMAHRVTFKYYVGVIHFLDENYTEVRSFMGSYRLPTDACIGRSTSDRSMEALPQRLAPQQRVFLPLTNFIYELISRRLILTYLIPCHLLTTHTLPTKALLEPYPRLRDLFLPLSNCIKQGNLAGFDAALVKGEEEFVKRRIYLTLERGRDIALRNLLRKVFIAGGFEPPKDGGAPVRRTRVPVAEFGAAISLGSKERMENDEVECLLANMIYKVCGLSMLNTSMSAYKNLESHERLYLESSQHGGLEQGWDCIPRHWRVIDERCEHVFRSAVSP